MKKNLTNEWEMEKKREMFIQFVKVHLINELETWQPKTDCFGLLWP